MKTAALLLLATVAFCTEAHASASLGSLVLGFRNDGSQDSTGKCVNLTVNLGDVSELKGSLDLGNIGDELASTYGEGWASNSGLFWGIVGTNAGKDGKGSLFVSAAASTSPLDGVHSASDAWIVRSAGDQAEQARLFRKLYRSVSSDTMEVTLTSSHARKSWSSLEGDCHNAFGVYCKESFEAWGATSVDLYELDSENAGSAGRFVGSFLLCHDGELYFYGASTAAGSIPEPGTYALVLGGSVFGFVALRRRRNEKNVAL